ncbi:hypothetical protein BP5796_07854 [Coleophoma crateriformis]|uniref:Uncharacterized protein n=1 Tax=Coleophoma crateriformis TaxID=565419 RepID=A0A3D8RCX1_9HELO|nr:hypothetical protein BP5796_07854 [Coleophoma crateriformis]
MAPLVKAEPKDKPMSRIHVQSWKKAEVFGGIRKEDKHIKPRIILKMDNYYAKAAAFRELVEDERTTGLWSSKHAIYSWIQHPDAMTANYDMTTYSSYCKKYHAIYLEQREEGTTIAAQDGTAVSQSSHNEGEESNEKRYIIRIEGQKSPGYKILHKGAVVAVIPGKTKWRISSRIEDQDSFELLRVGLGRVDLFVRLSVL